MGKSYFYFICCEIIIFEYSAFVHSIEEIQAELLIIHQNETSSIFDTVSLARDEASSWNVNNLPPRYKIGHDEKLQVSTCTQRIGNDLICLDTLHRLLYRISPYDDISNGSSKISIERTGISMATKVVYDDVHDVVFWYDIWYNKLTMTSLDKNNVVPYTVLNMADIEDFCVAPRKGLVFYTKEERSSAIWRSSMLGDKRYTIVHRGIIHPISLIVNEMEQRIYWYDAMKMTIEYSDYDGAGRNVILATSTPYRGIQLLSNKTIIAYNSQQIQTIDYSSENTKVDVLIGGTVLDSILLIKNESKSSKNTCQNLRCEHYCVTQNGAEKCICTNGYVLHTDGQRCLAPNGYIDQLVFTTIDGKLCVNNLTVLAGEKERPSCMEEYRNVTLLSYNRKNRNLYFSTFSNGRSDILHFQVDIKKGNRTVVNLLHAKGIAKDNVNNIMYVLMGQSLIAFNSSRKFVVRNDIFNASHLICIAEKGLLFWYTQHKGIDVCSPRSGNVSNLVAALNVQSMVYNHINERLYWTTEDGMWSVFIHGTDLRVERALDHYNIILAMYKDLFYMSSKLENKSVMVYGWRERKFLYDLTFSENFSIEGLVVIDSDAMRVNKEKCLENNDGCQHICYVNEEGNTKCSCKTGYRLKRDRHSCYRDVQKEDFLLVSDAGSRAIFQMDTYTNDVTSVLENSSVIDFDLDPHTMEIFFSTHNESFLSIVEIKNGELSYIPLNGLFPRRLGYDYQKQTLVFSAFDGKSTNLYVMNVTDSTNFMKLDDDVHVTSIALHIGNGYVFTTTSVPTPQIHQYDYIQMQKKDFSVPHLQSPTGITVDQEREEIYWVDVISYTCYKSKMMANPQMSTVFYSKEFMPKRIALDESFIYILGNNGRYILQLAKASGGSKEMIPVSPLVGFIGSLHVYRKDYCPSIINGGKFQAQCTFLPGTRCIYSCDANKNDTDNKIDTDTSWTAQCLSYTRRWYISDNRQYVTEALCSDDSTSSESTTKAVNGGLASEKIAENSIQSKENSRVNGAAIALGILFTLSFCGLAVMLYIYVKKRRQRYHGVIVDRGVEIGNIGYGGEKEI